MTMHPQSASKVLASLMPAVVAQDGLGTNGIKQAPFPEGQKQRTPMADMAAVPQPLKHVSFIRTVPMQHVQSHYTDQQSVLSSDEHQVTSIKCVVPDKAWRTQLTTAAFVPLISLSPESSSSSVGQDSLHSPEDSCTT